MDRKTKGTAVVSVSAANLVKGIENAARAGAITREEEHILRMRNGARVPMTHVLERADGGNPTARAKVDEIQAALFHRLFEEAGDGPSGRQAAAGERSSRELGAKNKIVRALKRQK